MAKRVGYKDCKFICQLIMCMWRKIMNGLWSHQINCVQNSFSAKSQDSNFFHLSQKTWAHKMYVSSKRLQYLFCQLKTVKYPTCWQTLLIPKGYSLKEQLDMLGNYLPKVREINTTFIYVQSVAVAYCTLAANGSFIFTGRKT